MKKDFKEFEDFVQTCYEAYEQANPVRMYDVFNLDMIYKDEKLNYLYHNDPHFVTAMETNCTVKEIMILMMEKYNTLLGAYVKKELNNV